MELDYVYHEEPWNDDRLKRADWFENCPNPGQSNMFARYLSSIMSEQRRATSREQWRRWRIAVGIESSRDETPSLPDRAG